MLYLIKMKLLQELVDRLSSVNSPKYKFINNYTSFTILLRYVHGFTDLQTTADVDSACIVEIVY